MRGGDLELRDYIRAYHLTAERLRHAKAGAVAPPSVPVDRGIEITGQAAHVPRSLT